MANEFKVKKGLIVEGSGGTILDVQGSVGQLFSITDSLTGDLFAVSDISGIPILNVNSSGAVDIDGDLSITDDVTLSNFGAGYLKTNVNGVVSNTATIPWSTVSTTPTTISGYGITDALQIGTTAATALAGNTSLFDGAYSSLSGTPTLGTAAASATGDFLSSSGGTVNGDVTVNNGNAFTTINIDSEKQTGNLGGIDWNYKYSNNDFVAARILADSNGNWKVFSGGGDGVAPATAVTVNSAQRVGIGVTDPLAKLHVDGSVRFEDLTSGILKVDADGDLSVDTTSYSTFDGAYSSLSSIPSTFAPSAHNHDDRYYTETEIDNELDTLSASLRANTNITGGGTITVNSSGYIKNSARFIVIANGRGTHFATSGYFDINIPTSGTVTGVGGSSNKTATSNGVQLDAWEALYYILPVGSSNTSVAANFRVAKYTSNVVIPETWILLAVRNGDSGQKVWVINKYGLELGHSVDTTVYDSRFSQYAASAGSIAYSSVTGTPTLGTAAAAAATDFATAAQGLLADSALQSETFGSSDIVMSIAGNDLTAGVSVSLAGGLSYNASTNTLTQADNDTVYTHPTGDGNNHIPTGGAAGQFLKYSSSGAATWATPSYTTNTNTTYSAGTGLDLTGTTFSIEPDLRDGVTRIGKDTSNYIAIGADTNVIDFHVGGVWVARMESDGDLHMKGDVIAFSDIFNP